MSQGKSKHTEPSRVNQAARTAANKARRIAKAQAQVKPMSVSPLTHCEAAAEAREKLFAEAYAHNKTVTLPGREALAAVARWKQEREAKARSDAAREMQAKVERSYTLAARARLA